MVEAQKFVQLGSSRSRDLKQSASGMGGRHSVLLAYYNPVVTSQVYPSSSPSSPPWCGLTSFLVTSRVGHTQEPRNNWLIRQIHPVHFISCFWNNLRTWWELCWDFKKCNRMTRFQFLKSLVQDFKTRDILSYFCLFLFDPFLVLSIIASPIFV